MSKDESNKHNPTRSDQIDSNMKIAYLMPFLYEESNGHYGRINDIIEYLDSSSNPPFDYEVHAFYTENNRPSLVSSSTSILPGDRGSGGSVWSQVQCFTNAPRIWSDLVDSDYDILHVPKVYTPVNITQLSTNDDRPLVLGPNIGGWYPIRNNEIWNPNVVEKVKNKFNYICRKKLLEQYNEAHILAFSQYHKNMMSDIVNPQSTISILRPGVSNIFSYSDTETNSIPELLYVGDFSHQKGYFMLLRALTIVDNEFHLRIVGSGDPNRPFIRELGLSNNVTIEGFVPRKQLPAIYNSSDLFIMPSIDEMGPNTIIESLACGTPVVSTDQLGISEYVPRNSGKEFWPRNEYEIAKSIDNALDNIKTLVENTEEKVDRYSVEHTVNQLHQIYKRL